MPNALITGGTSGIGKATAAWLHRRHFTVVVTGSSEESVGLAQAELPFGITVVRADARSASNTRAVADLVRAQLGGLDLLFLNAGVSRPTLTADVTDEAMDDLIDINFRGQVRMLRETLPLMVDGGSIVVTAGTGIRRGLARGAMTAATRGALLAMVPSLALELAPRRIRVNAISPGAIATPIWSKLGVTADAREDLERQIPFGRFGTSDEIASVVDFLASPVSSYVTGQEITVAGGGDLG